MASFENHREHARSLHQGLGTGGVTCAGDYEEIFDDSCHDLHNSTLGSQRWAWLVGAHVTLTAFGLNLWKPLLYAKPKCVPLCTR